MMLGRIRLSLSTQLLILLLAFGAIPLGVAITVGYVVSRRTIIEQGEEVLRELGARQAAHLSTELTRQHLILRTITGQFVNTFKLEDQSPVILSTLLAQTLPEDGVFDGLRLVGGDGQILARVALGDATPRWPEGAPATDWTGHDVVVHWEGEEAVAYLIAVRVGGSTGTTWLEGHVRSEDFSRLFSMPSHLMGAVESALFDRGGRLIVVAHEHAQQVYATEFDVEVGDSVTVRRSALGATPSLVVSAPVLDTDWVFAAALPLEAVLAPVAQLRNAAILGAGLLVLIIAITAVLAARSISTPMHNLALAARRFGRGESYHPIQRSGTAEVTLVVDAFTQMADDLQRSRDEIEQLHAREMERAHQLASVGELASGIAHEIRNPLTGVLGALDLAVRNLRADDTTRPLLQEAQQQLRRMEGTTTQLLRYARPPELREVTVDPNDLAERAARLVDGAATATGVDVRIEPTTTSAHVTVDPELMVQVLLNLMLNGIQAMGKGGELTVWIARHPPELWIGIRDTGPGVPADSRTDVFRPFFTTKHQGTGLGLSISRQIVERHGGSLHIEETPGGGATFVVAVPLTREERSSA